MQKFKFHDICDQKVLSAKNMLFLDVGAYNTTMS